MGCLFLVGCGFGFSCLKSYICISNERRTKRDETKRKLCSISIMTKREKWIVAGLAVAAAIAVVIYFSFDPATTPFPRCIFLSLTGLKCPGCGSQRAIHSLLHLDLAAAWRYNAFFLISIPYLALLFIVGWFDRSRSTTLYRILNHRILIWCYAALAFAWWILRNIVNI